MCTDNVHFCFISPHTMLVLLLRYTLLFITTFNYVNGFNRVNFNLTYAIQSVASYLKEHDLTIVDLDNKRILYFIVNENENITRHFRRSEDNGIEKQVLRKLDHIMNTLSSNGMYASIAVEPSKEEKVAYVEQFMRTRIQATAYLYEELQRIKHTGIVKDSLRKMISFLEIPRYHRIKKKVFKCFFDVRKKVWTHTPIYWTHNTNDLNLNIL